MAVPKDEAVIARAEQKKMTPSQALAEILIKVRESANYLKTCINLLYENNEILKAGGRGSVVINKERTITYDQMLAYLGQRPMYNLSPKQIYYMVERGDDIKFIMAVSGYNEEEIKKKYQQHRKNNVYR